MKKIFLVMTFLLILLFQVTAVDVDSVSLIWNPKIETTGKLWFTDTNGTEESEFLLSLNESKNIAEAEFDAHYRIISASGFTLEFSLVNSFGPLSWSAVIGQSSGDIQVENSYNLIIPNDQGDLLTEGSVNIKIKTESLDDLSSSYYESVTSSEPTIIVTLKT